MKSDLVRSILRANRKNHRLDDCENPATGSLPSGEGSTGFAAKDSALEQAISARVHGAVERFARELDLLAAKAKARANSPESAVGRAGPVGGGASAPRLGDTQHIRYPDAAESDDRPTPPRTERLGLSSALLRECMQQMSGAAANSIRIGLHDISQKLDERFHSLAAGEREDSTPPEWIAVLRAELASLRTGVQTLLARGREEMVLIQEQDGAAGEVGSSAAEAAARIEAAVATLLPLLEGAAHGEDLSFGGTPRKTNVDPNDLLLARLERIDQALKNVAGAAPITGEPEWMTSAVGRLLERVDNVAVAVRAQFVELHARLENNPHDLADGGAVASSPDVEEDQAFVTAIATRGDALRRGLERVSQIAEKNAEHNEAMLRNLTRVEQLVEQGLGTLSARIDVLAERPAAGADAMSPAPATADMSEFANWMRAELTGLGAKVDALAEGNAASASPGAGAETEDKDSRRLLLHLKRDLSLLVHTLNNHFQENAQLAESIAQLRASLIPESPT